MAAYSDVQKSKVTSWSKRPAGDKGAIEFILVVKAGIEKIDLSSAANIKASMANGNVQGILPCFGNLNAGSPAVRPGTGGTPEVLTGSEKTAALFLDDLSDGNSQFAHMLNNHMGRFSAIFIYGGGGSSIRAEHCLNNEATQRYFPVSFYLDSAGEQTKTAGHRWQATLKWFNNEILHQDTIAEEILLLPAAPVQTVATSVGSAGFTLNWGAVANATAYEVDVATDLAFSSMVVGFDGLDVGDVVTYAVTGLSATTTYFARIRAKNGNGEGVESNILEIATTA